MCFSSSFFQEQKQQKINLKIVIGGDCFRLLKFPQSYQELDEIVHNMFENKLPDSFCFKYEDSDNDSINIESNSDYEAFQEYCISEKIRTIKLRIDTKNFKQYFNQYDQQYIQSLTGGVQQNLTQQNLQNAYHIQQCNTATGLLVNPYMTLYQNILNGNIAPGNFSAQLFSQNNNMGQNNNLASNIQATDSSMNQVLMQMLLMQQGIFNTSLNIRNGSTTMNNNINNNQGMNGGNMSSSNVNLNNNTNAVTNSLSSQQQIPTLSKGASEVQNANNNSMNMKRQSINQSQSGIQMENLSFAYPSDRRQNQSITGSNLFNNNCAPFIKQQSYNNATNFSNQFHFQTQNSQQFNESAKFNHNDSINPTFNNMQSEKQGESSLSHLIVSNKYQNKIIDEDIQNPMDTEAKIPNDFKSSKQISSQIKRTDSMSVEDKDTTANIETRSQTTGIGTQGSNYSQYNVVTQLLGASLNKNMSLSQYTANQSREAQQDSNNKDHSSNINYETNENDFSNNTIKRELSPSLSQNTPLQNSTNNLPSNRTSNKNLQISTLRSGQNPQIPCDKCIMWDEQLKNNSSKQSECEKTPVSNTGKDLPMFTPNPECCSCDGSGYLKIEDQNVYNIVQTIMRHKLKEAELILKSLQVRQQKVEKIIPKESMDWLQGILKSSNDQQSSQQEQPLSSPFDKNLDQKKKEFGDIQQKTQSNMITKNIHLAHCFVCKNDINKYKYFYLCITCKQKNIQNQEFFPQSSPNDIDLDHILCECCEESHDSSHLLVQTSKEDIVMMHATPQQAQQNIGMNQFAYNVGNSRMSNLEKSLKVNNNVNFALPINSFNNNIANQNLQNYTRQSEPRKQSYFTQSMGIFHQNNAMVGQKATFQTGFNPEKISTLEQSTHITNIQPQMQLQQQQSFVAEVANFSGNQEMSKRTSIADGEFPNQILAKMRSKSDIRSQTTIVRNSIQHGDFEFDIQGFKGESQSPTIDAGVGRHSTNQNAFKNVLPRILPRQVSLLTSDQNIEDKPPTFNDSKKFIITAISQEQQILQTVTEFSPVVKQHFGQDTDLLEFSTSQRSQQIAYNLINNTENNEQEHDKIKDLQIANMLINYENNDDLNNNLDNDENNSNKSDLHKQKQTPNQEFENGGNQQKKLNDFQTEQDSTISSQKVSVSVDINSESNKTNIQDYIGLINGSICVKTPFNTSTTSKLTQSTYLQASRPSLTSSMMGKPDDSRMQYRAKLVNSYCSNEMFQDDSVIVFQEILNNGSENWPENVYLKCISGITDNCQYPVIQINKGELMSMAFPIKIDIQKINEGEQVKTAWRLYYQQQNEERKFFGPKITIDFHYKKPKKIHSEQNIDSLVQSSINTIKNIFSKDDSFAVTQFVNQNKLFAQDYLKFKNENYTISKLIIKYVEQYVEYKNKKALDEKQQD